MNLYGMTEEEALGLLLRTAQEATQALSQAPGEPEMRALTERALDALFRHQELLEAHRRAVDFLRGQQGWAEPTFKEM